MSGLEEEVCLDCGRFVMAEPQAAAGFIAACGRRLTRLAQCRSDIGCKLDAGGEAVLPENCLLDRVSEAISAASCEGREGPFGLYDYSGYGRSEPYRVRDFRDPRSQTWGHDVFRSDDRELARRVFDKLTARHIAAAAIAAANEFK